VAESGNVNMKGVTINERLDRLDRAINDSDDEDDNLFGSSPDNEDYEGYQGNYAGSLEYWYYTPLVVFWPCEREPFVLLDSNPTMVLKSLVENRADEAKVLKILEIVSSRPDIIANLTSVSGELFAELVTSSEIADKALSIFSKRSITSSWVADGVDLVMFLLGRCSHEAVIGILKEIIALNSFKNPNVALGIIKAVQDKNFDFAGDIYLVFAKHLSFISIDTGSHDFISMLDEITRNPTIFEPHYSTLANSVSLISAKYLIDALETNMKGRDTASNALFRMNLLFLNRIETFIHIAAFRCVKAFKMVLGCDEPLNSSNIDNFVSKTKTFSIETLAAVLRDTIIYESKSPVTKKFLSYIADGWPVDKAKSMLLHHEISVLVASGKYQPLEILLQRVVNKIMQDANDKKPYSAYPEMPRADHIDDKLREFLRSSRLTYHSRFDSISLARSFVRSFSRGGAQAYSVDVVCSGSGRNAIAIITKTRNLHNSLIANYENAIASARELQRLASKADSARASVPSSSTQEHPDNNPAKRPRPSNDVEVIDLTY
jgi:hypothetical protein